MPFASCPRTTPTAASFVLLSLTLIVVGVRPGSASAQTLTFSTGDILEVANDSLGTASGHEITEPTVDYRDGNEPLAGDDIDYDYRSGNEATAGDGVEYRTGNEATADNGIDYRNGNEPTAPAHIYVAQMDDHVFDGTWSEPSAPSSGRVSTAAVRMNVFNPAGAQAKVRFQVFDDLAHRWWERDSMLPPGHRTRLTQPHFALAMQSVAEGGLLPTIFVVASDQPVHPEGVFVFTVESWDGNAGTLEATESRRTITFKKANCNESGNEWLCNAPVASTGWQEWAAE
jgi:hypothetical protein